MNFLSAILDTIVGFIRRNPVLCLVLFILAVAAPTVLKGIAVFILYFILGIIVLGFVLALVLRWRIYKLHKQMGDSFGDQGYSSGNPFDGQRAQTQQQQPGEVKVYRTQDTPEKKVAKGVGDYVDFEETQESHDK